MTFFLYWNVHPNSKYYASYFDNQEKYRDIFKGEMLSNNHQFFAIIFVLEVMRLSKTRTRPFYASNSVIFTAL